MILIDSSAWIEYFKGNETGKKVEKYIKNKEVITSSIVLVEISIISKREGWNFEHCLDFVKSNSIVTGLNDDIIKLIGEIYFKQREIKPAFSVADAIIYSTTLFEKAKLLTKDHDFEGLKDVIFLK